MYSCSPYIGPVKQSKCNPKQNGQLWKWNYGRLCNNCNKCLSIRRKVVSTELSKGVLKPTPNGYEVIGWPESDWNSDQVWSGNALGQLVSSSKRFCLSVSGDSDAEDAVLSAKSCQKQEEGQFWWFYKG